MTSRRDIFINLLVYGVAHALVDAICAGVLTSLAVFGGLAPVRAVLLYLFYNFLAFAMQAPLGLLLDEIRRPREAARLGLGLQVAALAAFSYSPEGGVFLAGLGNALFHLGGGVVALNLTPERATAPGIFVAPGAVGLFLGIRLGSLAPLSPVVRIVAAVAALALGVAAGRLPLPENYSHSRSRSRESGDSERTEIFREAPPGSVAPDVIPLSIIFAVGLIFFSIAVRSFVGLSLAFPWKNDGFVYAFALAAAAAGGKALGGFLSDRFGFMRVCVGALLLSIPLLQWGGISVAAGLAGCLCFQMTMSVTLLAYVRAYPGREAWAFGLACFALFAGSLPLLLPLPHIAAFSRTLNLPGVSVALTLASIGCLWRGLAALGYGKTPERIWASE
jgi:FSR family fosmidomycin resistance protein-like MFS transporter